MYTVCSSDISFFKHPLFIRHFIRPVQDHLSQFKTYTLCPTLEQLLRQDIFYLEEEKLFIPLWHEEIVFHGKIKINITPKLPSNIEIDENNNLMVYGEITDTLTFGSISILINPEEKKEKRIIGKGIPRIQQLLYDVHELSDIILLS